MNKFIFTVPEIHHSEREVIASSYEEALELLKKGYYWDAGFLSYSESLEPSKHLVQEANSDEVRYWTEEFGSASE